MRWGQRKRQTYIAEGLVLTGKMSRAMLMREFGVSRATASHDLSAFQAAYPGAMAYDKSAKVYHLVDSGKLPRPERSAASFSREHAGYLAEAASRFLAQFRRLRIAWPPGTEGEQDALRDRARALESAIYEWRKREVRAQGETEGP